MRKFAPLLALLLTAGLASAQPVRFEFSNVRFRTGSSSIDPATYPALDSLARFLKASGAKVEIAGHTDNVGNAAANRALSLRRAESVKRFLTSRLRIPSVQLTAKGYGQIMPKSDNTTAEGRAQNRRVEVTVLSRIRTARVSFLMGNAFVRKQGVSRWEPASAGRVLTVLDELATDSAGRLEIALDNGGRLKLRPGSSLVIERMSLLDGGAAAAIEIGLRLGKLHAKLPRLEREFFSVITASAMAGLDDAEAVVEARPDGATLLSVWQGQALFRGSKQGASERPVAAGLGSRCRTGSEPEAPAALPKPPQPLRPLASDTLFYNPDRPKPFDFAWETPPAGRSRLTVARDVALNEVVADVVTSGTAFQLPAQKSDRLYWQMNSVDSLGFEGQPWPLRSFEVRRKLDGPSLTVLQPLAGQRIGRREVLVTGSTDPKSSVTVNGAKAPVDAEGNFSLSVALTPGDNALKVSSRDRADNESATVLNVDCSPIRRFWAGPYLGAVKLVGGEWDMSTIGPSGGARFLLGLNDRLSLGAQAGYAQVGCIFDQAFEPRGEDYQTTLLSGALLARACPWPDLKIAPYFQAFAGAVSWTNEMDTTTIYKDFGTPEASQEDLSPHAGISLGARYQVNEALHVFLEASGGYLATGKYNVGHYDANNMTASFQAGIMFGF